MKKLLLPLIGFAVLTVVPLNANATCTQLGIVVRVTNFTNNSIAYLRRFALENFYYSFTVADPDLRVAVNNAVSSGQATQIVGNAASCPTAGGNRNGGVATVVRNQP